MPATAKLNELLGIARESPGGREFGFAYSRIISAAVQRPAFDHPSNGAGFVQRSTGWRAARVSSRRLRGA